MKRRSFIALAGVGLALPLVAQSSAAQAPAAAAAAAGTSASEIIDRVQAFYEKTKTFKAAFKQQYVASAYGKTRDDAGSVIFQKPGRMSWRYSSNGNRVVSDGALLRIYEKGNQQMFEQQITTTQYTGALSFLTGQGKLKQDFKFTKLNAKQMKYPTGYVLEGVPLQPSAAYERVFFYIDAPTYQVRRVLLIDAQNNRNRFDFEKTEVNTKPPKGEFAFTPPSGTRVIHAP